MCMLCCMLNWMWCPPWTAPTTKKIIYRRSSVWSNQYWHSTRCLGCGRWNENKCQFELLWFPMSCRANKTNKIERKLRMCSIRYYNPYIPYGIWQMAHTWGSNFHHFNSFQFPHYRAIFELPYRWTMVGKRVYVTKNNVPGGEAILITYSKHKYNNIRWHARQVNTCGCVEMARRREIKSKWHEYVISLSASVISSNEAVIDLLTFCTFKHF